MSDASDLILQIFTSGKTPPKTISGFPIGIALADGNRILLQANQAFCDYLGYSPGELLGMKVDEITHPDDLDRTTQTFHHLQVREISAHTYEKRYVRKDGSVVWCLTTVIRLAADAPEECPSYLGVVHDITPQKEIAEKLRFTTGLHQDLVENLGVGLCLIDREHRVLMVNSALAEMIGKDPEDFSGKYCFRVIRGEPGICPHCPGVQAMATRQPQVATVEGNYPNGKYFKVSLKAFPVFDARGDCTGFVELVEDLSAMLHVELALQESQERFRLLFEKAGVGMNMIGKSGCILDPNPAFCSFLGYSRDELKAMNVKDLVPPEELARTEQALTTLFGSESRETCERRFRRKDGALVWGEVTSVWVPGGSEEQGFGVCIIQDITRRKETQAQLEYLNHYDELTGLPNRALLLDRVEQSLHYARRSGRIVAVIVLDIDRFKVINDSLGYTSGSKLLCTVGYRLCQTVRETDTVARLGADEFAILATEIAEINDVGLVANKILRNLSAPLEIDGREIIPTASLGISLFPRDCDDGDCLMHHADLAMHRAKRCGRNTFSFFSPEMNQQAQKALELENALRQALNRGQFCLHYQPKVSLAKGRVTGCEALVRWNHPQQGLISPADFIPLAEETGLIVPLGAWVLKEACRQIKEWQNEGLPTLRVAVNLSARQFRDGDLPKLIQQILEETGLDPQWLTLELTESMVMDDPEMAISIMTNFKRLGVHLSLDDFGTGYSSLAYLSRFPIDSLKIDQSFVRRIVTDPGSAIIATSIIALAHRMRLRVVAEGVETEAQLGYLRRHGCDEMQGYLFSKPVTAEEVIELFRQGKTLFLQEDTSDVPTLLIVDDEPGVLSALRRLLVDEGYRVLAAKSAHEGLELLAQNAVQVIVTDQHMQGMSGTEFLGLVKALYPNTVRLVLSGYADLPTVTESVNEGALYKFLAKPWDDDHLRDQIRDAFVYFDTDIKPRLDFPIR